MHRPPNVMVREALATLLAERRGHFCERPRHHVERGLLQRRTHAERRVGLRVEATLVDHHKGGCGGEGSEQATC